MVGHSTYVQPIKQKAIRKYKNNPHINEEENEYATSKRNNKLDLTQNAPESKFLQQQIEKSGRSARP